MSNFSHSSAAEEGFPRPVVITISPLAMNLPPSDFQEYSNTVHHICSTAVSKIRSKKQSQKGHKFLLTALNCFSKFSYSIRAALA